jgi:hypothetical protein
MWFMGKQKKTDSGASFKPASQRTDGAQPPFSRQDFFRDLKKASRRVKDRPSQPDEEKH